MRAAIRKLTDDERETVGRNLGLVYTIAATMGLGGRLTDDVIQAGTLGLMRAAQKYDPARGFAFSTYAAYWIRQGIGRHVESDRLVHVPVHAQRGTRPESVTEWGRKLRGDVEAGAAAAMARPESLDATGRPTRGGDDPAEEAERADLIDRVRDAVASLPPLEREAVARAMAGESRKDVAKAMGKDRSVVLRTERAAHERLRGMLAGLA